MKTFIDSPADFALRLREAREQAGLSLRQAADLDGGISHSMWSAMENGKRQPSVATLISIAGVLQTTPLYLASGGCGVCPFCGRE